MATSIHDHVMKLLLGVVADSGKDNAAKLAEILRLLAKYRAQLIANTLIAKDGRTVRAGPFAGMTMAAQVLEGCLAPKLLGCYEQELHHVVERAAVSGYDSVINIGCAEGYYAVGLARLMPDARIFAYDINPATREVCGKLADENGVGGRIEVGGEFTTVDFARFDDGRVLVVCDIEGAELDLLDPVAAPALKSFDLLVELHDVIKPGAAAQIADRFAASHDIERFDTGARDIGAFPELAEFGHLDQLLALWEWRTGPTPWMFMRART